MDREKLKRGWVWNLTINSPYNGSIQGGKRPWVIVSNDMCNTNSPTIHMAPLTTREKRPLPTHVDVVDGRGINSTVLLEQIEIFNVDSLVGNPVWKLKDSEIAKVNTAIAVQFGNRGAALYEVESYLAKCEEYLNNLYEKYKEDLRQFSESLKVVPNQVSQEESITDPPEVIQEPSHNEEPIRSKVTSNPVVIDRITIGKRPHETQLEKFNRRLEASNRFKTKVEDPKCSEVEDSKPVKDSDITSWSLENIKKFLKDLYFNDTEEVSRIWNLTEKSVTTYKSRFLKGYKQSFSIEDKRKFISDCIKLPLKQVAEKWCIPSNKDIMKIRAEFEVDLG